MTTAAEAPEFAIRDESPPMHGSQQARRVSDPFALSRDHTSLFGSPTTSEPAQRRGSDGSDTLLDGTDVVPLAKRDRRMSKEWDASKTPPSRFQKVEGSIYATPASRDGHVARNKIHGFKEKVKELGGVKKTLA